MTEAREVIAVAMKMSAYDTCDWSMEILRELADEILRLLYARGYRVRRD